MNVEVLCTEPQILLVHDFVTEAEAAYLIAAGEKRTQRSTVVCDKPGGCVDAQRTSDSAHLGDDPNVEPIRQRAREFAGLQTCEPAQIVRYFVGQEFRPHLDAFDAGTKEGAREIRMNGQRGATLLVYLKCPDGGGATVFPKAGLSVLPIARAAIYWRHHLPNGQLDPRALHGGAPVTAGTKVAANLWLRLPRPRLGVQINRQLTPATA
jgi:prolyl 4-hydroxylase